MTARVPAQHAVAVAFIKRIVDQHIDPLTGIVTSTPRQLGDDLADFAATSMAPILGEFVDQLRSRAS